MYHLSPQTPPPGRGLLADWGADLRTALVFLTRLSIRAAGAEASLARAARAFPLVGLLVGLLGAAAFGLGLLLSLPAPLAALLAVAATVLATGALHEDGLADVADGFGGGADRERKLAIMRDSRTGNYGALALILSVLARAFALAVVAEPAVATGLSGDAAAAARVAGALVAAHAASRALLPAVMHREPLARDTGLAVAAGRPQREAVLWSLGLGGLIAILSLGLVTAIVGAAAAAAAVAAVVWLARRQIGGYTGDVLGAAQQAAEVALLLAVVALA